VRGVCKAPADEDYRGRKKTNRPRPLGHASATAISHLSFGGVVGGTTLHVPRTRAQPSKNPASLYDFPGTSRGKVAPAGPLVAKTRKETFGPGSGGDPSSARRPAPSAIAEATLRVPGDPRRAVWRRQPFGCPETRAERENSQGLED